MHSRSICMTGHYNCGIVLSAYSLSESDTQTLIQNGTNPCTAQRDTHKLSQSVPSCTPLPEKVGGYMYPLYPPVPPPMTTVNHSLPVGTRTCAFAYPVGSYCFAGLTSELFLCWLLIGFSLFGRSCGSFDHPGSGTPLRFPASTVGPTQFGFDLHIYAIETAHALQALRQSSQSHFSVPETQLNTEELMA